jgi:hypothetical protein
MTMLGGREVEIWTDTRGADIAGQLATFWRDQSAIPFAWGRADCALVVADWWQHVHGADPAASLRGTYATHADCHTVLVRAGGLVQLVAKLADGVGAHSVVNPEVGAFGVASVKGKLFAGIQGVERWGVKAPDGMMFVSDARPVALWAI